MSDTTSLANAYKEFLNALSAGDLNHVQATMADDYSATGVGRYQGALSKSQVLDLLESGKVRYDSLAINKRRLRVVGDTGTVTGVSRRTGTVTGNDFETNSRVLSVWNHGPSGWQIVASHLGLS